jgi:cytochrome bd-type quinol oxidase subunit 2
VHLYELPLCFVLIGLVLYVVLAGADFGAGFWQLLARGPRGARIRDHTHHAMAPVWEANHVWLIFVITVTWTAYPTAFGAIASTLSVPLFIAAVGIILRGASYALRAGASTARETRTIDTVFAVSSVLTPFALGTMIGAIASQRVPVGNAAGHLFSSWLNPTSVTVGVLAVATSAYLAAVFLAADADRAGDAELVADFRTRALAAGLVAGMIALGAFAVLHSDAHRLYERLLRGDALVAVIVSALAGLATLELVRRRGFAGRCRRRRGLGARAAADPPEGPHDPAGRRSARHAHRHRRRRAGRRDDPVSLARAALQARPAGQLGPPPRRRRRLRDLRRATTEDRPADRPAARRLTRGTARAGRGRLPSRGVRAPDDRRRRLGARGRRRRAARIHDQRVLRGRAV